MSARAYRLPAHVRPSMYRVSIHTDPSRSDFSGTVSIDCEAQKEVSEIVLHSRALTVRTATVVLGSGAPAPAVVSYQPEQQTLTLKLARPIPSGSLRIELVYGGQLALGMQGIYLATDGTHRAVCTQCEATACRLIFPCFDEPEFKARLAWNIRTGSSLLALANGREESRAELPDGEQLYSFAPTQPMSSYLAALAVGDFESSPERVIADIPMRVYAPRGKAGQTGFALDLTTRLLPFYESYFDYAYPFGKYDQVAVPGFDAGAMENVGLVLFRQNLLLMDPRSASWRQEKNIARVVAHEFAHMWFGNLVTMRWWDDLWLNEAFAEWMAHKACHAVEPSYEIWNDFIEDKARALFDDALHSTHPIYTPVETPEQALEMFDSITYQKGCAVMRMLEHFLGEEPFRAGLRSYMKRHQWGNAAGKDLWQALGESSGQPVATLMKSWIEQPGFPVVAVSLDGAAGTLSLSQQRYFSDPKATPSAQLWCVPMVVRYEDDDGVKEHRFLCEKARHTEKLPSRGAVRWAYPNAGDIGFYRMQLDDKTSAALLTQGLLKLTVTEQVGFLEDQWALVRSGQQGIRPFLNSLTALASVRDHSVLRALVDRLDALDLLVKDSADRPARLKLRALIDRLFGAQLDELGPLPRVGESQNDTQRRALLIGALSNLARVPKVIALSEQFAAQEQKDPHSVDPNLAGIFVAIAAKFGDEARFSTWIDTFLSRKNEGRTPQEVARYLHTLSIFRRPGLPEKTLALIESGTVPQEAVGSLLSQLLSFRHGQEAAWRYLKDRWLELKQRVGDLGLSRVVEALGRLRAEWRTDIVDFFKKNQPQGAERALLRALERMDQAEELRRRVTPDLLSYLNAL